MNKERSERAIEVGLLILLAALLLLVVFGLPAFARVPPTTAAPAVHPDFQFWASTNGTKNGTANSTTNHTIADLLNQINLLWGQFNGIGPVPGVWGHIGNIETDLFYLGVGIAAVAVISLVGFVYMVRTFRKSLQDLRDEKIGIQDPNLYPALIAVMDKALGSEATDLIDKAARKELERRIRARAAEKRVRLPGTAGPVKED